MRRLESRGAPLNLVQQLLGHVDIQTTLRYAHLAPKDGLPWINNLPVLSDPSKFYRFDPAHRHRGPR